MDGDLSYWDAHAALVWQDELGADEALLDTPVNRYALEAKAQRSASETPKASKDAKPPTPPKISEPDPLELATAAASKAQDLAGLLQQISNFNALELSKSARHCLACDGTPSDVMVICEAPDREDDPAGALLQGAKGALFDKMFAAIGLARGAARSDGPYVVPVLPWSPPQGRGTPEELASFKPLLLRHIELAAPKVIVALGNSACHALTGQSGMTRRHGTWSTLGDVPVLPIFEPSYLLKNPNHKREAWADLLALKAKLRELS